jgi:hypothetical protein
VRRAIKLVEGGPPAFDPATKVIEWYAGSKKTAPVQSELDQIERRWMFARNDVERARVARDAELLADRTKESLPGAPQDWKRTNLFKDEKETHAHPTSYAQEVEHQAGEVWGWLKDTASGAASEVKGLGTWLLVGGGVLLAWKGVDLLRDRQRRNRGTRGPTPRLLNARLEEAAEQRNAFGPNTMCPVCHRYHWTDSDGRLVPHESPTGGICEGSRRTPLVISSGGKARKRKGSR